MHGGQNLKGIYATSVANNAKSALPSDIVQYIKKSLRKSEMEKNKAGKKKRMYPKKSEIIKIYPVINSPPKVADEKLPFEMMSEKENPPKISDKEVGYKEVQPEYEHVSIDLDDLNPKLVCSNCPLKFDKKLELARHEILKHGKTQMSENSKSFIEARNDQKQLENMSMFNCSKCYRKFETEKSLKQHVSVMHSENIFQCTFCKLEFKLYGVMKRHQNKCRNGSEIMKIYPVVNSSPKM